MSSRGEEGGSETSNWSVNVFLLSLQLLTASWLLHFSQSHFHMAIHDTSVISICTHPTPLHVYPYIERGREGKRGLVCYYHTEVSKCSDPLTALWPRDLGL